ncbi:antibiotic biosynthesis monooxygenase [Pseudonocardia sp.]|uniref:antibiotic biosynthesis monooxygenase n=1 Tax=Pseudonocardia sp. TaxID=60912 RepID=UPI0026252385|nr:antibiotic biosynthesis monooxygenase [Pseudonocardia sp.]MCW2722749.1 Antibiotic biosynthesis monooxygenase [Pseudonocardia sp.]
MSAAEPVTVTVARRVAPGREDDFAAWSNGLTAAATAFPGYLGAGMLRPSRVGEPWHVVFRFDSGEHLRQWETSPERAVILAAGEELVHHTATQRVTGLETWFALPGRTAPAPPRWKMFAVSAACIYGLNLVLTLLYGWALAAWLLPLRLLVVSVPVTALMTWLVMPHTARLLQNWLYAPTRR